MHTQAVNHVKAKRGLFQNIMSERKVIHNAALLRLRWFFRMPIGNGLQTNKYVIYINCFLTYQN